MAVLLLLLCTQAIIVEISTCAVFCVVRCYHVQVSNLFLLGVVLSCWCLVDRWQLWFDEASFNLVTISRKLRRRIRRACNQGPAADDYVHIVNTRVDNLKAEQLQSVPLQAWWQGRSLKSWLLIAVAFVLSIYSSLSRVHVPVDQTLAVASEVRILILLVQLGTCFGVSKYIH